MTDIVTYCDIYKCEDCPRYGDDCDGSAEKLYTHKEAWGMTDLIRREDAIAYIERVINSGLGRSKSLDYIHKYISALPSAEANWIPCSERLPSEDGRYLATYPLMSGGKWISIKWFGKPHMPNRPIKGKCFYESDSEYGDVIWDDVIAWMPLPKPYKGGEE